MGIRSDIVAIKIKSGDFSQSFCLMVYFENCWSWFWRVLATFEGSDACRPQTMRNGHWSFGMGFLVVLSAVLVIADASPKKRPHLGDLLALAFLFVCVLP